MHDAAYWASLNEAVRKAQDQMTPLQIAVIHLRAAARWTDKEMENPILARAARDCARQGLEALGEPMEV